MNHRERIAEASISAVTSGNSASAAPTANNASAPAGAEIENILISAEKIRQKVGELGAQIDRDFAGETIHILIVLDGGCVFASDLVRAIRGDVMLHFIKASSYGDRTTSSGRVRIKGGIQFDLKGKRIIVVDDIVDTGRTAEALLARLALYEPREIRYAALLSKPARRMVSIRIDYLGFEIPNKFVVGYGMDHAQRYRHLADIHTLAGDPQE